MTKNPIPEVNNLFLLGTGFTKAVFDDAPLNDELLEKLISRYPQSPLVEYQCRYHARNIEVILTRLDLETVDLQSERLKQDRQKINSEIAEYFQQFRFGNHEEELEASGWLKSFATEVLGCNDAIVTLNYDCFLEGLLDYYKAWSPKGGYVNVENILLDSPQNSNNILIYKIHGSENFVISSGTPNKSKRYISFLIDDTIYPRSGKNIHFGGGAIDPASYIIAPSFVKIPHVQITDMINKAIKVAPYAKNMVIGGCSLRPEDQFIWLIMASFINKQLQTTKNLIIITPNADNIRREIERYWVGSTQHLNICPIPKTFQDSIGKLLGKLNLKKQHNRERK